jgi:hypothetical protein
VKAKQQFLTWTRDLDRKTMFVVTKNSARVSDPVLASGYLSEASRRINEKRRIRVSGDTWIWTTRDYCGLNLVLYSEVLSEEVAVYQEIKGTGLIKGKDSLINIRETANHLGIRDYRNHPLLIQEINRRRRSLLLLLIDSLVSLFQKIGLFK